MWAGTTTLVPSSQKACQFKCNDHRSLANFILSVCGKLYFRCPCSECANTSFHAFQYWEYDFRQVLQKLATSLKAPVLMRMVTGHFSTSNFPMK